jgi:hypothetical protein
MVAYYCAINHRFVFMKDGRLTVQQCATKGKVKWLGPPVNNTIRYCLIHL